MLRYLTAGETHGPQLTSIVEGLPSGITIKKEFINTELAKRQKGYGRGGRMLIEKDQVEILSGLVNGKTTGAPLTLVVKNKDWENWKNKKIETITVPRPGHADYAGFIKYKLNNIRSVLERASARETAIRTAIGAVAKQFLEEFNIKTFSFVRQIGTAKSSVSLSDWIANYNQVEESDVRSFGNDTALRSVINKAIKEKNTVGGVFEIVVKNVPIGLGSYVHWDRKLDANLARALMSIQAIKGVGIGEAFDVASLYGSEVHDEIFYNKTKGYYRKTNRAGGIEGGMSNGEDIVLKAVMKPIPTLMQPLHSVDMKTKKSSATFKERSDVCAVPAASVVAENVVAFEIAREFLLKFSGDSLRDIKKQVK